ncbi:hypothetical protein [Roseateles sp. P5_D6]
MRNSVRTADFTAGFGLLLKQGEEVVGVTLGWVDPVTGHQVDRLAQIDFEGGVTYMLSGSASNNEQGAALACQFLVNELNRRGGNWGDIAVPEATSDVDAFAVDRSARHRVLNMQCVRAVIDPRYWSELGREGIVTVSKGTRETAEMMLSAIAHKAAKLPVAQRAELVLVLDASDTPVMALAPVVESFREEFLNDAAGYGFRAVWVVGPLDDGRLMGQIA